MSESQLAKIAVSTQADEALSKSLERVNTDFLGGRISKTDLASWFFIQGANQLNEEKIEEVRKAHFNQVVYLDGLVKKLKSEGKENLGPDEIAALQSMLSQQTAKKRVRGSKAAELSNSESMPVSS
jgi:hypothetical protein